MKNVEKRQLFIDVYKLSVQRGDMNPDKIAEKAVVTYDALFNKEEDK